MLKLEYSNYFIVIYYFLILNLFHCIQKYFFFNIIYFVDLSNIKRYENESNLYETFMLQLNILISFLKF